MPFDRAPGAPAADVIAAVAEGRAGSDRPFDGSVSVVMPHYQDLENLDRCLALLERQTLDRTSFEIIVSDNASPVGIDAVRAVVRDRATVVISSEKGAGPTRNIGVAASRGRVLAFIDSDCRPDPAFLAEGVRMLDTFDVVGGAIRVEIASPSGPTPTEAFELEFAFHNEEYIRKQRFSVTAALFVSREAFDTVGPFRNDVSEDREWCNRATAAGYTLGFAAKAVVGHPARRDWTELERKWRRLTTEAYELGRERPFAKLTWVARSWVVLVSTLPHLARLAVTKRLGRVSDRLGAMAILIRLRLARLVWAHQAVLRGGAGMRKNPP